MAIINQFDKRSGITYIYESISYWDKAKQQPRAKRTLIGNRDPHTGEVVPTPTSRSNPLCITLSLRVISPPVPF